MSAPAEAPGLGAALAAQEAELPPTTGGAKGWANLEKGRGARRGKRNTSPVGLGKNAVKVQRIPKAALMYTLSETAAILRITIRYVRRLLEMGYLEGFSVGNRSGGGELTRITRESLERFMRFGTSQGTRTEK